MGQKVPGPPWSYSPTLNNCPLPIISKKLSPPWKIYHFKILHPHPPPTISGGSYPDGSSKSASLHS